MWGGMLTLNEKIERLVSLPEKTVQQFSPLEQCVVNALKKMQEHERLM